MKLNWAILTLAFAVAGCVTVPPPTHTKYDKISTAAGPEDIILDTLTTATPRLLVSCDDRRTQDKNILGDIYYINLNEKKQVSRLLPRINEPDSIRLHPHGFDLIRQNGIPYLYVVSHDDIREKHTVIKYKVNPSSLEYINSYEHSFLVSPNSVVALKKGGFYVSNDQGKRGDKLAIFLAAKTGNLVYCDEKGGWAKVVDKLAYPNGLYITPKERYLYISTSRQHQILKFTIKDDGNLLHPTKVVKITGGDNIRPNGKQLLIPAHLRLFKFLAHASDSSKLAPSVVYSCDHQGNKTIIYANKGDQISAASTAIYFGGYYYLGQIFEPFILKIKKK